MPSLVGSEMCIRDRIYGVLYKSRGSWHQCPAYKKTKRRPTLNVLMKRGKSRVHRVHRVLRRRRVHSTAASVYAVSHSLGAHADALRSDISTSRDIDNKPPILYYTILHYMYSNCGYGNRHVCFYVVGVVQRAGRPSDSCEVCLIAPRHIKLYDYLC